MKKILNIIFGILLSIIIPVIGMLITNLIEHGIAVSISIISIPFIGLYLFKSKHKQIGIGVLIGLIPIIIFSIIFIGLSKLH